MTRQLRRLILLLVALALVAGAAWLTASAPEKRGGGALEEAQPRKLLELGAAEQIEICNAHGNYTLSRKGVADFPTELIEMARVENLLKNLTALEATPVEDAAQESVYGLDAPEAQAKIFCKDGSAHTLEIGILEVVSGRYYCRVDEDAAIYMVDAGKIAPLKDAADSFLSLRVTPECHTTNPLGAVRDISFVSRDEEILIEAADSERHGAQLISFGAVTHVVRGPKILHEMDRTNAQEIFASLFDVRAESIVEYGLSEADLKNRGFDDPDMTVRAVIRNGNAPDTPEEIWVLRAIRQDGGRVWLTLNDGGVIYSVPSPEFMEARYGKLVNRQFVSPLMVDVRALLVEYDGQSFVYEIGGSSAEPVVTHRGSEVDLGRFRAFYTLAVSAASDGGEVLSAKADGSARTRVEFIYRDAAKQADVLEMYELDERRCLVAVNGVAEFAMRNGYERAIKTAVEALNDGGALPQSW